MANPLVRCPYNKSHFVQLSRYQIHLLKCEKKYPPLEICPYNYSHRFLKEEISQHIANCPSKQVKWPTIDEILNRVTFHQRKPNAGQELKTDDPFYENWDDFYHAW